MKKIEENSTFVNQFHSWPEGGDKQHLTEGRSAADVARMTNERSVAGVARSGNLLCDREKERFRSRTRSEFQSEEIAAADSGGRTPIS